MNLIIENLAVVKELSPKERAAVCGGLFGGAPAPVGYAQTGGGPVTTAHSTTPADQDPASWWFEIKISGGSGPRPQGK